VLTWRLATTMRTSVEPSESLDAVLVCMPLLFFFPMLAQGAIQFGISFGLRAPNSFACSSFDRVLSAAEHSPSLDSELASHTSQCILTDAPTVVAASDTLPSAESRLVHPSPFFLSVNLTVLLEPCSPTRVGASKTKVQVLLSGYSYSRSGRTCVFDGTPVEGVGVCSPSMGLSKVLRGHQCSIAQY